MCPTLCEHYNFSGVSPVLNVGNEVTLNLNVKNTDNSPVPYSEYSKMGIAVTSGSNSMIGVQIDSSQLNVNGTIKVKYKQAYTMSYMTLRFYMKGTTNDFRILLNKPAGPVKPPTPKPIPVDPPTEPMSFAVISDDPGVVWIKEPLITISKSATSFTYDQNGNLTKQSATENNQTTHKQYGYNERNQLISYSAPDGSVSSYSYYADGMRKSKTVQNQTTVFYYQGADIVNETTGGQLTATNLKTYGMVGRITQNGYRSYVKDGHGDVVKMLNAQGTQVASYQYEGYGLLTSKTGAETNPFRYSGEYFDEETGFIYLRARYYNPEIMRFITEDPHWNPNNMIYSDGSNLPDMASIVQSTNMYAYCMNNPMSYVDPSGKWATVAIKGVEVAFKLLLFGVELYVTYKTTENTLEMQEELVSKQNVVESKTNSKPNDDKSLNKSKNKEGFDKQKKGTPSNNQAQNKQFNDISKKLRLNKEQQNELHREITHRNYNYQEILEIATDLFSK